MNRIGQIEKPEFHTARLFVEVNSFCGHLVGADAAHAFDGGVRAVAALLERVVGGTSSTSRCKRHRQAVNRRLRRRWLNLRNMNLYLTFAQLEPGFKARNAFNPELNTAAEATSKKSKFIVVFFR